jgi:hypothetical protein
MGRFGLEPVKKIKYGNHNNAETLKTEKGMQSLSWNISRLGVNTAIQSDMYGDHGFSLTLQLNSYSMPIIVKMSL